MTVKQPYVLAMGSFAVHGTASLKTFITFLGDKILPVPSLILNGLTNMSLVKKFDTPFKELLQSTLELAVNRELELIVYIGYLGKAEQAGIILEMLDTYSGIIKTIITDPVCGDHGRSYVPDEVIKQWPILIQRSNIVFPNITELKILTGFKPDDEPLLQTCVELFKQLFPKTQLVVTSIKKNDYTMGIYSYGTEAYEYQHPLLPKNYGGSGDAFLALFILNHYYRHLPFNDALKLAADQTYHIIKKSIESDSSDLLLQIPTINPE
jgi:pyridoxine kinase